VQKKKKEKKRKENYRTMSLMYIDRKSLNWNIRKWTPDIPKRSLFNEKVRITPGAQGWLNIQNLIYMIQYTKRPKNTNIHYHLKRCWKTFDKINHSFLSKNKNYLKKLKEQDRYFLKSKKTSLPKLTLWL
jgi:hypothetical protein